MNSNYNRGVRFERQVMAEWTARGYQVSRTAGSHSSWDVIAYRSDHPVVLIQCKCLKTGTVAQAINLVKNFKAEPPLFPSRFFHQVIEVYAMKAKYRVQGTI